MPEVNVEPTKDVLIEKEVYDAFGGTCFAALRAAVLAAPLAAVARAPLHLLGARHTLASNRSYFMCTGKPSLMQLLKDSNCNGLIICGVCTMCRKSLHRHRQ